MMRDETSHRFLDRRGWWRNRRAVRVEPDALVIEGWLGDERRVPWVDVVGLRWASADAFDVETPEGVFHFDRHMDDLAALASSIRETRAAAPVVPAEADLLRWLGGEHHVQSWAECEGLEEGHLHLVLATGNDAVPHTALPTTELTVDASGVTLRTPTGVQHIGWRDTARCERTSGSSFCVTPVHGPAMIVDIPLPEAAKALEAIERVLRGLSEAHLEAVPPPPGALSLAREGGGADADSRSLSRVEPEEPAS
jgi:hypothetical protein